jgi:hypothetical protein
MEVRRGKGSFECTENKSEDELFHLVADNWISRFEGSVYGADDEY